MSILDFVESPHRDVVPGERRQNLHACLGISFFVSLELQKSFNIKLMKTTLCFLGCFALFYLWLPAQSFELALQPGFFSEGQFIEDVGADNLVIAGEQRTYYPNNLTTLSIIYRPYLILVDVEGSIVWERRFEELGHPARLTGLKVTPENHILVYGYFAGCDYSGQGYFYEFDLDGNVIYKYIDDDINSPYFPKMFSMDIFPNGDFLIPRYTQISRFNRDIEFVNGYSYRKRVNLAVVTQTDSVFFTVVMPEDSSINISSVYSVDSIMFPGLLEEIVPPPGRNFYQVEKTENEFALLTEGYLSVFQLYPYLQFKEFPLVDYGQFTRFDYQNNQFAFLGKDATDLPIILYTDTSFQNPTIIPIDVPNFNPVDLALSGETVVLTGAHISNPGYAVNIPLNYRHPYGSSALYVKQYELNGNNQNSENDLTITDISWATGPHLTQNRCSDSLWYDCPATFDYVFKGIEVRVKNTGATTINSLNLNTRKERCMGCFSICYLTHDEFESYSDLNLAPNEETTLYFGDIEVGAQRVNTPFDLCFWASVPNQGIDINPENDVFCEQIPWDFGPVGYEQNSFTIYPNPARDNLEIEFPYLLNESLEFRVINTLGQLWMQGTFLANQTKHTLDVSSWSTGNYVLEVLEGEQIRRQQFIVRR